MAIKLKVREEKNIHLKVGGETLHLKASEGVPIYPSPYSGRIEVTPSEEEQTLETSGYMMMQDIIVNPIPSNYGLITYNGSIITVS